MKLSRDNISLGHEHVEELIALAKKSNMTPFIAKLEELIVDFANVALEQENKKQKDIKVNL